MFNSKGRCRVRTSGSRFGFINAWGVQPNYAHTHIHTHAASRRLKQIGKHLYSLQQRRWMGFHLGLACYLYQGETRCGGPERSKITFDSNARTHARTHAQQNTHARNMIMCDRSTSLASADRRRPLRRTSARPPHIRPSTSKHVLLQPWRHATLHILKIHIRIFIHRRAMCVCASV